METKIAYQTNEQGYYVGEVFRQPSPLEPGVWLLPGGAVEVAPPTDELMPNHVWAWRNEAWVAEEMEPLATPVEITGEVIEEAPVSEPEETVSVQRTRKKKS